MCYTLKMHKNIFWKSNISDKRHLFFTNTAMEAMKKDGTMKKNLRKRAK